jgi:hypothetical protein
MRITALLSAVAALTLAPLIAMQATAAAKAPAKAKAAAGMQTVTLDITGMH